MFFLYKAHKTLLDYKILHFGLSEAQFKILNKDSYLGHD